MVDNPEAREDERRQRDEERQQREMERAHDANREIIKQANDATVQSGQLAARMIILINGGAAGAMLAFIANLVGKTSQRLGPVADPLICFVGGVVAGTVCLGAAYLANYFQSAARQAAIPIREHPYFEYPASVAYFSGAAWALQAISIGAGLTGIYLFAQGALEVRSVVRDIRIIVSQECKKEPVEVPGWRAHWVSAISEKRSQNPVKQVLLRARGL